MPHFHQRAEMPQKQRAQQGGDVQAVGIGVGEYADLAITQAFQVTGTGVHAHGHRDIVHFTGRQHLGRFHLPCVEYLATQRHHRLKLAVARLLGGTAGGIPLHQEQFADGSVLQGTVRQLAG